VESTSDFCNRRSNEKGSAAISVLGDVSSELWNASNAQNFPVFTGEVVSNGRLLMLRIFREQAIAETVHRYGNIV